MEKREQPPKRELLELPSEYVRDLLLIKYRGKRNKYSAKLDACLSRQREGKKDLSKEVKMLSIELENTLVMLDKLEHSRIRHVEEQKAFNDCRN